MKSILQKTAAITLALITGLCIASFAQKKTASAKAPERWVKVYRDIMLGDQSNTSIGQFLKTATGQAIAVEDVARVQKEIGLVFFTEYGGNYATLTFPGNAAAAASYGTDQIGVFTEPGGLNNWEPANMHSGYITNAGVNAEAMSQADFNTLAESNDWNNFSKTFRKYNSGSGTLSYVLNYTHVETNTVYLIQIGGGVRAFLYVKSLVPKSAKGGSMKFDMIIEGSDEYKNTDSNLLQPAKH